MRLAGSKTKSEGDAAPSTQGSPMRQTPSTGGCRSTMFDLKKNSVTTQFEIEAWSRWDWNQGEKWAYPCLQQVVRDVALSLQPETI